MRIVFLDFYGVMDGPLGDHGSSHFHPVCGALINDFCHEFNARIVITSDAVQEIKGFGQAQRIERAIQDLVECGVGKYLIVGYTQQDEDSVSLWDRPNQIKRWVDQNEIKEYVIFDDINLLFTEEQIELLRNNIKFWGVDQHYIQKWIARLPQANPEAAARFVRVDNNLGLTKADIDSARTIFNSGV